MMRHFLPIRRQRTFPSLRNNKPFSQLIITTPVRFVSSSSGGGGANNLDGKNGHSTSETASASMLRSMPFLTDMLEDVDLPSEVPPQPGQQGANLLMPAALRQEILEAVNSYDLDGNGIISPNELVGMMWMIQHKAVTPYQARGMMEHIVQKPCVDHIYPDDIVTYAHREGVQSVAELWTKLSIVAESKDAEAQSADVLFDAVYRDCLHVYEGAHVRDDGPRWCFPKEVIIVSGPPACGKVTCSNWIREERSLREDAVINMAEITKSDASVGDTDVHVAKALVRILTNPRYQDGIILLQYPRSDLHAKFLLNLKKWVMEMTASGKLPVTCNHVFHFLLLHVDAETSVSRQLRQAEQRVELGIGGSLAVTDAFARERYKYYKEHVFPAVQVLRDVTYYHQVDCTESLDDVRKKILQELQYRTSLEMTQATSSAMAAIPMAASISQHAKQGLVYRLDRYARNNRDLLKRVIDIIKKEFMHIVRQQAITGTAIIRSVNPILDEDNATNILLDVMAERGYVVTMDVEFQTRLRSVSTTTGECKFDRTKVYHFEVKIPRMKKS